MYLIQFDFILNILAFILEMQNVKIKISLFSFL